MKLREYIHICLIFLLFASCEQQSSYQQHNSQPAVEEDEWVEVEIEEEEDCPNCYGDGYLNATCNQCGGLGHKTIYHSGTRPKACSSCMGTGVARCNRCNGNYHHSCEYCDGRGSFQCTVCHGYGIIVVDPSRPHLSPQCNNCNGTGYEKCMICRGTGNCTNCNNGLTSCPTCWGSGYYGQESYSYSEEEDCPYCNSTGRIRQYCYNCTGTGTVIVKKIVKKLKSEVQ